MLRFGFSIVLLYCCLPIGLKAQQLPRLDGSAYDQLTWEQFVERLETNFPIQFYYDPATLANFRIVAGPDSIALETLLTDNLESLSAKWAADRSGNIFITSGEAIITQLAPDFFQGNNYDSTAVTQLAAASKQQRAFLPTSQEYVVKTLQVGNKQQGLLEKEATISGTLRNEEDQTLVVGATLFLEELGTGTASNFDGFFTTTIPKGKYTLVISSINFEEEKYRLEVLSSGRIDLSLNPQLVELKGVVVRADRDNKIQNTQMGFERLSAKSIKEIPLVLGERDVLKVATLLPGIQSVGEGASGFNVRGSPADQNLFYINQVPVYNTSHMFGFFSAFNSDAINEFSLAKSNIPIKFGGRLASIFDIKTKQGNKNKYTARGGISPITGRLLVEGPIQKEKSSFLIGLRSTYSDWVLKLIKNIDFQNAKARFADGVVNLNFKLSDNDRIKLFSYYSFDDIRFGDTEFDYENAGASAIWTHFFKDKHNVDVSLVYSKYDLNVADSELPLQAYRLNNQLLHREGRIDFTLRPTNDHELTFGANAILYGIDRGEFLPLNDNSAAEPRKLGEEQGLESGFYLGEQWKVSSHLTLIGGLRYNLYAYLGPQSVLNYPEGIPRTSDNVSDTLAFGNNETIRNSGDLDYRLAASYAFSPNFSLKASYNKLHQYIFLLSNTVALAPTDKWKLSDYHIDPMEGQQYSLGMYTNLFGGGIEFSLEGYYKKVKQLVEYKDGANLLFNEAPEQDVLQGQLDAYGFELMLKKSRGRLNGWLNYTYSKSSIIVEETFGESINFGQRYPANFDKPHSVNLVSNYKFSRRLSISSNIVYSTGRPITYPTTIYYQNGKRLINYSARNEYRIPDYFRVDLSVKIEGNLRAKKALHGTWVFSVYNLLGRKNAYSVFFESTSRGIAGKKVSIFGVPVFSATYNFKLGNYAN